MWTRLGLNSAISPGILVVGGGRVRAVITVGFCRVIPSRSVHTGVLVLIGVQGLPVRRRRTGRTVAVRDSCSGAVVSRIRGRGLGQRGGFLRRMVHAGELEGALEIGGLHTRDPPIENSGHRSKDGKRAGVLLLLLSFFCNKNIKKYIVWVQSGVEITLSLRQEALGPSVLW